MEDGIDMIDFELIGLYKFEVYYDEKVAQGNEPYTLMILSDSLKQLAYGIAQQERDQSMAGMRMYFEIGKYVVVKDSGDIRMFYYDENDISPEHGADFTHTHYVLYLTDPKNPMNVSDDPDTYTKFVDAVSALYKPDDFVQLFIDAILGEALYNSPAVQGEIKFWRKHDEDTQKVERVYAEEYLKHLYLRDWSRIEKKEP